MQKFSLILFQMTNFNNLLPFIFYSCSSLFKHATYSYGKFWILLGKYLKSGASGCIVSADLSKLFDDSEGASHSWVLGGLSEGYYFSRYLREPRNYIHQKVLLAVWSRFRIGHSPATPFLSTTKCRPFWIWQCVTWSPIWSSTLTWHQTLGHCTQSYPVLWGSLSGTFLLGLLLFLVLQLRGFPSLSPCSSYMEGSRSINQPYCSK